jgi:kynureninase
MSGFSTRAIKAATTAPKVDQIPSSVPIYQAAAFSTADAAELGDVLTGAIPGYAYSRIDNPTTAALGDAVAALEGAEAGLAFATGMAAIHATIVSVVRAGQTIVATKAVYGTTRDLLVRILSGLGIATEFVDPRDPAAVDAALARTGAPILYVETISNPTIVVSDLAALATVAHSHGALLLVDNTFASPYGCRPIELGADLVAFEYWNRSSRYFGSGQSSSATRVSSSSATARTAFWAGMTLSWKLIALASACTEPASWAACWACSRAWMASTSWSAEAATLVGDRMTPLDCRPESSPRYFTAAGRIMVLAMSSAQLASMFETLT